MGRTNLYKRKVANSCSNAWRVLFLPFAWSLPPLLGILVVFGPLFFFSTSAVAQVVRLPVVEPESPSPPGQLVSHPDSSAEILQAPGELDVAPATPPPDGPKLPPGVRNGFFQKVLVDATWLAPSSGANGLEIDELHTEGIFALPCPTRNAPLVISPGFDVQSLQTRANVDVPQQLYTAYTQFRWLSQVTPQWGLDFAVTPGVYSDFKQDSNNAFRLTGHGAAAWTWTDKAKIVLGAAYLDMPDTNVIPIGGLLWTPTDDWNFELIFPHPKIARRMYWTGQADEQTQDWAYVAGEFTNDQWSFRQTNGASDQVLLRDYRLILGVERKVIDGLSSRVEIGYVFGRRVRYAGDTPDFYPADTVLLRGGLTY
jgi:hypothetical protein